MTPRSPGYTKPKSKWAAASKQQSNSSNNNDDAVSSSSGSSNNGDATPGPSMNGNLPAFSEEEAGRTVSDRVRGSTARCIDWGSGRPGDCGREYGYRKSK